jgi:hypothetical protein
MPRIAGQTTIRRILLKPESRRGATASMEHADGERLEPVPAVTGRKENGLARRTGRCVWAPDDPGSF